MKLKIKVSDKKDKKYEAIFIDDNNKKKSIHFGLKNSTTYLDTGDKKLRDAYRARHKKKLQLNHHLYQSLMRRLKEKE